MVSLPYPYAWSWANIATQNNISHTADVTGTTCTIIIIIININTLYS